VKDADGRPVPGAVVKFESALPLGGAPHPVTTETAGDGGYRVENAFGYGQTVSVEKDGYLALHREIVFEDTVNRLDLELEPQGRTLPGFCAWISILALPGGLLAVRAVGRRKK
jgi:hypothetical protein